jgi:hypothetical protein
MKSNKHHCSTTGRTCVLTLRPRVSVSAFSKCERATCMLSCVAAGSVAPRHTRARDAMCDTNAASVWIRVPLWKRERCALLNLLCSSILRSIYYILCLKSLLIHNNNTRENTANNKSWTQSIRL